MSALEPNPSQESVRRKSATAFRTIAEVAGELELPAHVLRFWESKFLQVKPLKRRGGRRYYRPEDVSLLRHIRTLLYTEGYTIRGVQKLLRESGGGKAQEGAVIRLPAGEVLLDEVAGATDDDVADSLADILAELEAIRGLLKGRGS